MIGRRLPGQFLGTESRDPTHLQHEVSYLACLRMDERTKTAHSAFMSLCLLVDIFAVGLCIGAKQHFPKGKPQLDYEAMFQDSDYHYHSHLGVAFTIAALLYLLAGKAMITTGRRCMDYGNPSKLGAAHTKAITFFTLKWVSSIAAGACLLAVLVLNIQQIRDPVRGTSTITSEARGGKVADAGIGFALLSLISSVSYYIFYAKATKELKENAPFSTQIMPLLIVSK